MSKVFKLVVASSKSFEDDLRSEKESYEQAYHDINQFIQSNGRNNYNIIICSRGEDHKTGVGEMYAFENNVRRHIFWARWNKHGKKAGSTRDRIMLKEADAVILFWDGACSKGNRVIGIANRLKVPLRIIYHKEKDRGYLNDWKWREGTERKRVGGTP